MHANRGSLPNAETVLKASLFTHFFFLIEERQADASPQQSGSAGSRYGESGACAKGHGSGRTQVHSVSYRPGESQELLAIPLPVPKTNFFFFFWPRLIWPRPAPMWVWFPEGPAPRTLFQWGLLRVHGDDGGGGGRGRWLVKEAPPPPGSRSSQQTSRGSRLPLATSRGCQV